MRQHLTQWVWSLKNLTIDEKLVLLFLATTSENGLVSNLSWKMMSLVVCMSEANTKKAFASLQSRDFIEASDEDESGLFHVKINYPE